MKYAVPFLFAALLALPLAAHADFQGSGGFAGPGGAAGAGAPPMGGPGGAPMAGCPKKGAEALSVLEKQPAGAGPGATPPPMVPGAQGAPGGGMPPRFRACVIEYLNSVEARMQALEARGK